MAQALLELGRLFVAQDGSIVGGQLPLLGPQVPLLGFGSGLLGHSRHTSSVSDRREGPLDPTIGLLHLRPDPFNQSIGLPDQLIGRSDVISDPLGEQITPANRL